MGDIEKKGEVEKEIGIFKTINDLPDSKAANSFRDVKLRGIISLSEPNYRFKFYNRDKKI